VCSPSSHTFGIGDRVVGASSVSESFDVIVVGAGSAGCVVASRLSENPDRSVLLLEAGPDRSSAISPALRDGWGLARGPDWTNDWGYTNEPNAGEEPAPLRRGKLVGGTSWLTRFAVRGSPADFDGWAARGLGAAVGLPQPHHDDGRGAHCRLDLTL
jgi:choline dehydrogenase